MKPSKPISAIKAASALAQANWPDALARHETPGDFMREFVTAGIAGLQLAASDTNRTAEERAAAAYSLACVIEEAAEALRRAFPNAAGNPAAPDCGLIRATTRAVKIFHEIAAKHPEYFSWRVHYAEWPVNIAPDGNIHAYCKLPKALENVELFGAANLPKKRKRQSQGRSVNLGSTFAALASEMFYRANVRHQIRLTPPKKQGRWLAWERVDAELDSAKSEILARPELAAWMKKKSGLRAKDGALWGDLKGLVKDSLGAISRR